VAEADDDDDEEEDEEVDDEDAAVDDVEGEGDAGDSISLGCVPRNTHWSTRDKRIRVMERAHSSVEKPLSEDDEDEVETEDVVDFVDEEDEDDDGQAPIEFEAASSASATAADWGTRGVLSCTCADSSKNSGNTLCTSGNRRLGSISSSVVADTLRRLN
jgi:hypothetical protein